MKKLLAVILCASIVAPSFAFADNDSNKGENRDSRKSSQVEEKKEKREEKRGEVRETKKENIEEKREEHKEKVEIKENKKNKKAQKQAELVNKRLIAAIERIQKLSDRVSEKLNKFEKKGYDMSVSRARLAEAKVKLEDARAKTAEINLAIRAVFADTTTSSTATTTTSTTSTPVDAMKNVQVLAKEVTTMLQDAHRLVVEAISSIKPGINKGTTATSTTPVATTTPDVIAPVISSVATSSVASTTAVVAWTTSELATGKVYFGTSTPLTLFASTTTLGTAHSFNLTGLNASTTYSVLVESADAVNNVSTSTVSLVTTN